MAARRLASMACARLYSQGRLFGAHQRDHLQRGERFRVAISKCRGLSDSAAPTENVVVETKSQEKIAEEVALQKYMSMLKDNGASDAEVKDLLQKAAENASGKIASEREDALGKALLLLRKRDLSAEEMEQCLQVLQTVSCQGGDAMLGTAYLRLAQLYDRSSNDDKVVLCCDRAMTALEDDTIEYGMCVHLIAHILHKKREHEACIEKLKKVGEILEKKGCGDISLGFGYKFLLASALSSLGRHQEAVPTYLSAIALQENLVDKNQPNLADNYITVAEALAQVVRLPEAVEFCQKALNIYLEVGKKAGLKGTLAEAAARRLLAILYKSMDESAKVVEQNRIVREILLEHGRNQEARLIDVGTAVSHLREQRYDDAMELLNAVLGDSKCDELVKGMAHINLAKMHCLRKGGEAGQEDAASHCDEALKLLHKFKSSGTVVVAEAFSELGSVFESMKDYETALDVFKQAEKIYSAIPGQMNAVAGAQAQMGTMCYFLQRYDEALSYLGRAARILEDSLGKEHHVVGSVLNQMGVANLELKNLVVAADQFERAKKICIKSYGLGGADTLAVNHNLVVVYSSLARWDKAIKCQTEILKELERQNASEERLEKEREVMKELEVAMVTQSM